jgi:hypothetical protein
MKNFKLLYFFVFILLIPATLNSCKIGRFVVYNFADINDHKKFPAHNVESGTVKFRFPTAEKGKVPKELNLKDKHYPFEKYLEDNNTVA